MRKIEKDENGQVLFFYTLQTRGVLTDQQLQTFVNTIVNAPGESANTGKYLVTTSLLKHQLAILNSAPLAQGN